MLPLLLVNVDHKIHLVLPYSKAIITTVGSVVVKML